MIFKWHWPVRCCYLDDLRNCLITIIKNRHLSMKQYWSVFFCVVIQAISISKPTKYVQIDWAAVTSWMCDVSSHHHNVCWTHLPLCLIYTGSMFHMCKTARLKVTYSIAILVSGLRAFNKNEKIKTNSGILQIITHQ